MQPYWAILSYEYYLQSKGERASKFFISVGAMNFNKLLEKAREYLPAEKISLVEDAYRFASEAHQGQVRKSGL